MKWESGYERTGEEVYFFVKSNNPRPTFHRDMPAEEPEIMTRHVEYWTELARQGVSVVFGPVADPHGAYGIGVYKVDSEAQMLRLLDEDPAKGLLVCEATPMANAVVGHSVRYPDLV